MTQMGKLIIVFGVVMAVVGVAVWALGRVGFRGLPGDIRYESERLHFYFPIVTCVVLSVLLTLGLWLWGWLTRR